MVSRVAPIPTEEKIGNIPISSPPSVSKRASCFHYEREGEQEKIRRKKKKKKKGKIKRERNEKERRKMK